MLSDVSRDGLLKAALEAVVGRRGRLEAGQAAENNPTAGRTGKGRRAALTKTVVAAGAGKVGGGATREVVV